MMVRLTLFLIMLFAAGCIDETPKSEAPTVEITSPANQNYSHFGFAEIAYDVVDDNDPTPKISVILDGAEYTENEVDLVSLASGPHELTIKATDYDGNSGTGSVDFNVMESAKGKKVIDIDTIIHKNGTIELLEISLRTGGTYLPTGRGDYAVRLTSINGSVIYEEKFEARFWIAGEPIIDTDEATAFFRFPFTRYESKYELLHNDAVIFEKNLNLCDNDGSCERSSDEFENIVSCPSDCPSGSTDNYCDGERDGICDTDCLGKTDSDCTPPSVEISSPISEQKYYNTEESVYLDYAAFDDTDRRLDITMTLDGVEFNGTSIDMSSLSIDSHTLVIKARDDDGSTGRGFVAFEVIEDETFNRIGFCNSYELPMSREVIDKCVCPEGYDKFNRFQGAMCLEHHEDSMKPCSSYTDCPEPELCVGYGENFSCRRVRFGCYTYYTEKDEIESICVD